ncbi:MAG: hypothetical protein M1826_004220 [Phylliscum demangeonii]|nr:MAG: hypothetical protein M1826_004220 [Phylliscum demangeonii]
MSRPPETDAVTYLTILQSHLTEALLPTLLDVLQDPDLTAQIGWDLVGLLVPLLPASQACLDQVARLGNPREVVLKITEALQETSFDKEMDSDEESGILASAEEDAALEAVVSPQGSDENEQEAQRMPSKSIMTFTTLLGMLSVLQTRIKTKYPSRFLSSALRSVLGTYRRAVPSLSASELAEITQAIILFTRNMAKCAKPALPPRQPHRDSMITAQGTEGHSEDPSAVEFVIERRLLQCFVTHVIVHYSSSGSLQEDDEGLAWAVRFEEILHPERVIPNRSTFGKRYAEDPQLQTRDSIVREILPDSVLDAVLALGLWAHWSGRLGDIAATAPDEFSGYLQLLSSVAAQNPSPTLRYHAHLLCSFILSAHPSEAVRLAFIRDTLQHCPFSALKGIAMGWLKDQILEATNREPTRPSLFMQPDTLRGLAPYLFPDLRASFEEGSTSDEWDLILTNFNFYLASLNFYYFLLVAQDLRKRLDVEALHADDLHPGLSFVQPLRLAASRLRRNSRTGGPPVAPDVQGADFWLHQGLSDLLLLEDALERIRTALSALDK